MSVHESIIATKSNKERVALSGGTICPRFIENMKEISRTNRPRVVIDTSARKYPDKFKSIARTYDELLENNGVPLPEYLQAESESQSQHTLHRMIDDADILLVLGGSTQLIHDRWNQRDIADRIYARVASGALAAAGASAGAMIWFENGYSDSMQQEVKEGAHWNYIKSDGLGLLPCVTTAHHSDVDEHSRPRDIGFRDFLLQEAHAYDTIRGVGFDTFASLIAIEGVTRVINLAKDLKDPSHHDKDAAVHVYQYESGALIHTPLHDESM